MRRILWAAVIATMAVLAIPAPAGAKSKPRVVVLKTAQLAPAMLALEDMPTGWSSQAVPASSLQASTTSAVCNGPNAAGRAQSAGVVATAGTEYSQDPNTGPFLSEFAYVFPTAAVAQSFMTATKTAVKACTRGWQTANPTVDGGTVQFTIALLPFKVGDQTLAYRQIERNRKTAASETQDTVYLRKGNNVLVVDRRGASSFLGLPSSDARQLLPYSQKALDKLGVALAAAKKATTTAVPTTAATTKAPVGTIFTATGHGSADTTTATFSVPSTWDLDWSFNCSRASLGKGNFVVSVFAYFAQEWRLDPVNRGVNEIGRNEKGVEHYQAPVGRSARHLEVFSEQGCTWTLTVTEG